MEPPILSVVRARAEDESPSQPNETEPARSPLRWTLPISSPREETGRAS